MDIVERLQGMAMMRSMTWVTADKSKRPANIYSEAADEIEWLREELNEAHHQLDYWQKMASPTLKFMLKT
jgi:5-bromo-4-chloroindolyl phosphate hydrolysis protein